MVLDLEVPLFWVIVEVLNDFGFLDHLIEVSLLAVANFEHVQAIAFLRIVQEK